MMAVQGSIQTRTYEDKEGKKRKAFEVVADNVFFCGDKAPAQASADISREAAPAFAQGQSDDYQICDDNEDLPFN